MILAPEKVIDEIVDVFYIFHVYFIFLSFFLLILTLPISLHPTGLLYAWKQ